MTERVIVGVTGATGQIFGIRTLELLADTTFETHLIVSKSAKVTIEHETDYEISEINSLATVVHNPANIGAETASGSFQTKGMIVTPCSMKTLSNIASGNAQNLITRSADVMLKEHRPLLLMPREKPYNRIHLQNMLTVNDAGAIVYPPFPSFYQQPPSIDEMVTRTVARALSMLEIDIEFEEWNGISP
jgi:4-hydroxy-3-polyprenylbenzoate decarboxylase